MKYILHLQLFNVDYFLPRKIKILYDIMKLNDYIPILGTSFIFKCIKTLQFGFNL